MKERLQKIIARAGIASRRHAEDLILSGQVRVNGRVVTEMGTKADPACDRIEAAGQVVELPEADVWLALHKPPRVVATLADPEGRPTLRHFLRGLSRRVFPVGRLEFDASGLILLTSDGERAARLLKAAPRLRHTYWIKVKGRLSEEEQRRVAQQAAAQVRLLRSPKSAGRGAPNPWYEVALSGASRDLLRRALFEMNHPVEKLRRVSLAGLELGDLPEGRFRELSPGEVAMLERAASGVGTTQGLGRARRGPARRRAKLRRAS